MVIPCVRESAVAFSVTFSVTFSTMCLVRSLAVSNTFMRFSSGVVGHPTTRVKSTETFPRGACLGGYVG